MSLAGGVGAGGCGWLWLWPRLVGVAGGAPAGVGGVVGGAALPPARADVVS